MGPLLIPSSKFSNKPVFDKNLDGFWERGWAKFVLGCREKSGSIWNVSV